MLPHDFDDVAAVRVTVTDAEGNTVTSGNPLIEFKIAGPGEIAAIDNAARDNHEGFRGSQIHAAAGECCAWLRSTADAGDIYVTISSPGLSGGAVSLTAQPPGSASPPMIAVDTNLGPVVLEASAGPVPNIQVANRRGLGRRLAYVASLGDEYLHGAAREELIERLAGMLSRSEKSVGR